MAAQERANRILAAWVAGESGRLKTEIEEVLLSPPSNAPESLVETEERELLEGVALDLWIVLVGAHCGSDRLRSGLALLEHLARRSGDSPLKRSCAA